MFYPVSNQVLKFCFIEFHFAISSLIYALIRYQISRGSVISPVRADAAAVAGDAR